MNKLTGHTRLYLLTACLSASLASPLWAAQAETTSAAEALGIAEDTRIVILYTNDFHSHIANTKQIEKTDGTSEEVPALRMSHVSQMAQDLRDEGYSVLLVDAGDEVQGSTYGAIDEGDTVIRLMNAAGYQLATPGNHEFDYGMFRLFQLADMAEYPYISSNFHSLIGEDPFEDTATFEFDGKTITFVGVTTPEAITSSTPTYFQNESGEFIYTIDGIKDPHEMYDAAQKTIDAVADDADYVIGIGHVGIGLDERRGLISSYDLIENTTGLDAFIDGHSHTSLPGELVQDKGGASVLLTQTGSYLDAVGVMELKEDGSIDSHLATVYDSFDPEVAALEEEAIQNLNDKLGQKMAELPFELYDSNPEKPRQRLVRAQETNLGDFIADSVYWYFNQKLEKPCNIAVWNGGGIRANIPAGDVTMNSLMTVEPFGNMICQIEATGQQLLDALEMGATVTGDYDTQLDAPAENGGFFHVSGLRYTIDASVPSSVVLDDNQMFKSVDGEYRVKDVQVYNADTKSYDPLELDKNYRISGDIYLLRNGGNGLSMFTECDMIVDYVAQDVEVLSDYFQSFAADGEYPTICTAGSPLSTLEGFDLDYENPYGSGRITILAQEATTEAVTEAADASVVDFELPEGVEPVTSEPSEDNLVIKTQEARDLYDRIMAEDYPSIEELQASEVVAQLDALSAYYVAKYGKTGDIDTPERDALREELKEEFLQIGSAQLQEDENGSYYTYDGEIAKDYWAEIVLGLPASGKSTRVTDPDSAEMKAFIFDCDVIKSLIPEFKETYGAAADAVHTESELIQAAALDEFLTGSMTGANLIFPVVATDLEALMDNYIRPLEEAGYTIHVKYCYSEENESAARNVARELRTGRIIKSAVVLSFGTRPLEVFEELCEMNGPNGEPYVAEEDRLDLEEDAAA